MAMRKNALSQRLPPPGVGIRSRSKLLWTAFSERPYEAFVTVSTGLAFGSSIGGRPEDFLRNSDTAMYRAKKSGKDHHALFNPEMDKHSSRQLDMEGDLWRALRHPGKEFRLHYQPKVSLETGKIVGVEGLLRWQHPKRGMVLPSEFMPLAEETGLIVPLGRWVLEEACRQGRKWRTQYSVVRPLFVTVNLSARQFRVPGLAGEVRHVLARTGLEPGGLILEITESALMEDVTTTLAALRWLQDFGVRLAIDDFGTGYSSLSYLKRFPVDAIKVDRSIVSGLGQDPGDAAIVSATITLAHALGLEVVAEGVETEAEVAELRSLGCDLAQGYYFWKPAPAQETAALLASSLRSDPHGPRTTQQRIGSSASSVDDAKISGTPRAAQP
jgi:EAL domain-containing protein (putative c-di-GMP-specific phosphodiesterase class I)